MNTAVHIKNLNIVLSKSFEALKDVSLELETGKIIGFIGPSGAGKTTLIRSIVGRQKLSKGSISIFGIHAGDKKLRDDISYMTQESSVYSDLTVYENLEYFATMIGIPRRDIKSEVARLLKTINLEPQVNQLVGSLSGGQKQRVSLGIALLGKPKLLVLDEPTVGLDPALREQLWHLFRALAKQGNTLIISSHVMDEAERCDDLVLIRNGEILAHDTPKKLCESTESPSVEQAFLKLIGGQ